MSTTRLKRRSKTPITKTKVNLHTHLKTRQQEVEGSREGLAQINHDGGPRGAQQSMRKYPHEPVHSVGAGQSRCMNRVQTGCGVFEASDYNDYNFVAHLSTSRCTSSSSDRATASSTKSQAKLIPAHTSKASV